MSSIHFSKITSIDLCEYVNLVFADNKHIYKSGSTLKNDLGVQRIQYIDRRVTLRMRPMIHKNKERKKEIAKHLIFTVSLFSFET
jgi:hypothetical protein